MKEEYSTYASNHVLELAKKYRPHILWNDLGWPKTVGSNEKLFGIFSEYLNVHNPDGVINNRWGLPKRNAHGK